MTQPKVESMASSVVDPASIARLARECSIEMNVQDARELHRARALLPPGKKVYVSHLPKQTWQQTLDACRDVRRTGSTRCRTCRCVCWTASARSMSSCEAAGRAEVAEILLISGDYPQASGPYSTVAEVLRAGKLSDYGLRRVSMAGHPEGHPKVPLVEIRRAEREKAQLAQAAGLQVTLLTQFFSKHRRSSSGPRAYAPTVSSARLVAGLSGPASIATLFRYAVRCGVGPSIRALGARPTSLVKLVGDHGPEKLMRTLAGVPQPDLYDGLHFFTFGGFLRTCEWLQRVGGR